MAPLSVPRVTPVTFSSQWLARHGAAKNAARPGRLLTLLCDVDPAMAVRQADGAAGAGRLLGWRGLQCGANRGSMPGVDAVDVVDVVDVVDAVGRSECGYRGVVRLLLGQASVA